MKKNGNLCRLDERGDLLEAAISGELALYLLKNLGRRAASSKGGVPELVEKVGRKRRDVLGSVVLQLRGVMGDSQLY